MTPSRERFRSSVQKRVLPFSASNTPFIKEAEKSKTAILLLDWLVCSIGVGTIESGRYGLIQSGQHGVSESVIISNFTIDKVVDD